MYYPINMKIPPVTDENVNINESVDTFFMEAVFTNGKETVKPLLESIQKIKDELDSQIKEHEESTKASKTDNKVKIKSFDPKAFWKNTLFKEFEDQLRDVFGFRNVEIHPYIERYITGKKKFESCELNCAVYHRDRFPVEGLVTDNGFYDKSHSLTMQIWISLGLLKNLTAEEVLAVLLHEFGHSIDPALTDIKYTETNILSKYITDRKDSINNNEKRLMRKFTDTTIILGGYLLFFLIYFAIIFAGPFMDLFKTKEGSMKEKLKKIKKKLESDKEQFNRQNYSEAFADNFARMYGYGHVLMKALKKMSTAMDRELRSRFKKEKARQRAIYEITVSMIGDVHKTDIHRIRNLIQEYKKDINDPDTPAVVKKQLEEDLVELEKVLDQYLNHRDEFQKRVNNLINDELKKLETVDEKKLESKSKDDKPVTEEVIFLDNEQLITESKKKSKEPLTTDEYQQVKERFGDSTTCSFAKDKDGYYCYTHRCRSKSYPTIDEIPQDKVDFVRSTS